METNYSAESRVLVVTDLEGEAQRISEVLADASLLCLRCGSLAECARELSQGAGAVVLAEELLAAVPTPQWMGAWNEPPAWSDVPVILLGSRAAGLSTTRDRDAVLPGTVVFMDRPWYPAGLVRQVRQGLRQRQRQYQLRALLAEQQRREASCRLLLERSPDAIFTLDPSGRLLAGNPACERISGYGIEELTHTAFVEVCAPDQVAATIAQFQQCLRSQTAVEFETAVLRKDGSRVEVWLSAQPILSAGRVVAVHATARDVTARKATEEALRAANQELESFTSIISHDLKEPLRGIQTMVRFLEEDYGANLGPEGQQWLQRMGKCLRRMTAMIQDLLEYSRSGRCPSTGARVALEELVTGVIESLAPPPKVRIAVAPDLPVVPGEPVQLQQVFQNLISNAIKYADKPQVLIRVDWADAGDQWQLSVSDNGPGIAARHFERIFQMFQTLQARNKAESTGVGLAVVKRIVECAGGRVWVESQLGQGSTFRFTWPKVWRPTAAAVPERLAA